MATLSTEGRNAACDGVVDLLNSGFIVFETAAHAEVATCTFGNPAFGNAAVGVGTANAIVDDSTATGGTVGHAHITKSDTSEILACTAGVAAEEFVLTSVTIGAGDTVSVTSLTITQPAS